MEARALGIDAPGWSLHKSRSTGAQYWFHSRTNTSLWVDDALPLGWAWKPAAADPAQRVYVHVSSGREQTEAPTAVTLPPVSNAHGVPVPRATQNGAPSAAVNSSTSASSSCSSSSRALETMPAAAGAGRSVTASVRMDAVKYGTYAAAATAAAAPTEHGAASQRGAAAHTSASAAGIASSAPAASAAARGGYTRPVFETPAGTNGAAPTAASSGATGAGIAASSRDSSTATVVVPPATIVGGAAASACAIMEGAGDGVARVEKPVAERFQPLLKGMCHAIGLPDDRPALERHMDTTFFGDAHKRVVKQIMDAIVSDARKQREKQRALHVSCADVMADFVDAIVFDVGTGTGATTDYLLSQYQNLVVYAIDLWSTDYYVASLQDAGRSDLAAAYAAAAPKDGYAQFCANFWDVPSVTPVHGPAFACVRQLLSFAIRPALLYIDADLHHDQLKQLLDGLYQNDSMKHFHVVGGGWDVSPGVQRAVTNAAKQYAKSLHVEQGCCWTLSRELLRETANTASAVDAVTVHALHHVDSSASNMEQRRKEWLASVCSAVERRPENAAALAPLFDTSAGGAKAEAVQKRWVNTTDAHKMQYTPLMRAAKAGHAACVIALLDAYGADVNVTSTTTALGEAVYAGHTHVVEALLARAADPRLLNRYKEDAVTIAKKRRFPHIERLLTEHLTRMTGGKLVANPFHGDAARGLAPSGECALPITGALPALSSITVRPVKAEDKDAVQAFFRKLHPASVRVTKHVCDSLLRSALSRDLHQPYTYYEALPNSCLWLALLPRAVCPSAPTVSSGEALVGMIATDPLSSDPYTEAALQQVNAGAGVGTDASAGVGAGKPIAKPEVANIQRLFVDPTLAESNLGGVLLAHAAQWLQAAGVRLLYVSLVEPPPEVCRLYTEAGFVEIANRLGSTRAMYNENVCIREFVKRLL